MTARSRSDAPQGQVVSRYIGNSNAKEVHDLQNESPHCQLAEVEIEHRIGFETLAAAHEAGYDNCHWCIGRI